jgi:hypothetical protein
MALIDFLKDGLPVGDAEAALRTIRAFKECESQEEWGRTPCVAWAKLEQLEEYLAHRVEGAPLEADTVAEMAKGAPGDLSAPEPEP